LAYRARDERGSVLVNFLAGPTSVPADIAEAGVCAVTLLYERRKKGMPLQSESFGGYSYSAAGPFTAEGALNTPECRALLAPYTPIHCA
jgi:hypothetical protein